MRAALLFGLTALALSSCETKPKKYFAPDAAEVSAAAKNLGSKIVAARAVAIAAKQATLAAQESATRLIQLAGTVREKAAQLKDLAPVELQWAVIELQTAIEKQQAELDVTKGRLAEAVAHNAQLELRLQDTEVAKRDLESKGAKYESAAEAVADDATNERNARIKIEKSLSWYRWHWWGSWIALASGVLACAVVAFLKFTGRLTLSAAQIAAKVGI